MDILADPRHTRQQAQDWAIRLKARDVFVDLARWYWKYGPPRGVDPSIAFAQAALETNWGRFGGKVTESHFNPCGLKIRHPKGDTSMDFQQFESWETGCIAHLDHLALYAGAEGYPKQVSPDPRHFPHLLGTARTVADLTGTWASDPKYAAKIEELVNSMPTEEKRGVKVSLKNRIIPREGWKARKPKYPYDKLNVAAQEGCAMHYMGPGQFYEKSNHSECASVMRSIQNYHMDHNGWNDVAYNFVICRHGYVFEGRGWGNRSAAQGSNYGNGSFHAFAFMMNDDPITDLTSEATGVAVALIQQLQVLFPGADDVKPHSAFYATACPGDEIRRWIEAKPWLDRPRIRPFKGFWQWLNWYEGTAKFEQYGRKNPDHRPDVPVRIPQAWWDKRKEVLSARLLKEPVEEAGDKEHTCTFPAPTQ